MVPELYTVSNSVSPWVLPNSWESWHEQSLYGNVSVGYGGFVYLEGTARVDQTSSLNGLNPEADNSYFYPSVAGTLLIHELGGLKDLAWMNYFKGED